ncbi:hypothetical protein [Georgenia subflava]|uniref:Integrase SAM-like N-terminal domain-containing protein n=1 Tax=Georgenia subflava TaxID=1622177 RepID=A0A6N7EMN9_9MICO|nr:hypothetical protein [Georgenia subflava]MPV38353.1 hypothetical protein [Georgenia subflava]
MPDSKVGLAARQWINELREQSTWPNPPILPQTVDEYERLLANHLVPHLGQIAIERADPRRLPGLDQHAHSEGQERRT